MKRLEQPHSFATLQKIIRTILPEEYQDSYESVEPVSMGSAQLKFGEDGKVAWDDIWDTFCNLAIAGGPPHKGKLLEPASREEIAAKPALYKQVVDEVCRGIRMVTSLSVMPSPIPGWVRVDCGNRGTAGWMTRAIAMENVSAHYEGTTVDLPAGPDFRVEKEIKNVVTVMAKTDHYWLGHMGRAQQREISDLFEAMALETPLIQPAMLNHDLDVEADMILQRKMSRAIRESIGLGTVQVPRPGWIGVDCGSVKTAIWMMRAMVASNVLSRREETVLFLPVNPVTDPEGKIVTQALTRVYGFADAANVKQEPAKP